MATYYEIQSWIKGKYGFTVKTCWIAHAKEIKGLPKRDTTNRKTSNTRNHPCPADKLPVILDAFRNFKMTN